MGDRHLPWNIFEVPLLYAWTRFFGDIPVTHWHSIIFPALVLATWTCIWLWGISLAEFLFLTIIGIPARRSASWTRTRVTVFGARSDGTWIAADRSGLLHAPIIFYVFSLALVTTHRGNGFDYFIAWCYALLRIACSLSEVLPVGAAKKQILFFSSIAALNILSVHVILEMATG
ncbi:hypothetical protein [Paraburkholderia solisilvae]|nr:hypothetical protein [Paraburkholderia solisilvae]